MENELEKKIQNNKIDDEPLFVEKEHKGLKWFIVITIILPSFAVEGFLDTNHSLIQ